MALALSSPAFTHNSELPKKYTCDGADVSPALRWEEVPAQAKSLALVVDDPDAPRKTWVHWVLYNLPVSSSGLDEAASDGNLPEGTLSGMNDSRNAGYDSPCPPKGTHRYFFKLYALDTVLPKMDFPTKDQLEKAMKGHVIEQAQLMGTFHH